MVDESDDSPAVNYTYAAELVRVIDGDTVDVIVDLGFGLSNGNAKQPLRLRFARIDTPEMNSQSKSERSRAVEAKELVQRLLTNCSGLKVQTSKADSFGRYLAEIWYFNTQGSIWINLNDELLEGGHAVLWQKRSRKKV